MKNLSHVIFFLLTAGLLAGCLGAPLTTESLAVNDRPKVVLAVEGDPAALEILRDGSVKCKRNPSKLGCIDSESGTAVIATFRLRNSPDWAFSRFEICAGVDKPAPGTCGLTLFERLEYGVYAKPKQRIIVPNAKGVVRLSALDSDLKRFFVANQNSVQGDYYYRVQVCKIKTQEADADVCLWNEDPPWVNRGRRH